MNSSLTWGSHIATKISKGNRMLGLIKRTVGFNAPYRVKLHLYLYRRKSVGLYQLWAYIMHTSTMAQTATVRGGWKQKSRDKVKK